MATVIDALLVTLGLDSSGFNKGTEDGQKNLEKLRQKAETVAKEVKERGAEAGEFFIKFAEKAAVLLGVGFSLHELTQAIKETAAEYTDLALLAAQFHTTTEAIDSFADSGKLLGLSNDVTIGGLKELDRAVQDTALGLGRAKKVFDSMGISVKDAAGNVKPTTQVMQELSDKFKGMERGKQIRIMERLGLNPALLKLFNADLADMQKRTDAIDKATGFSLDTAVKNSQAFTKASKAMGLEINTVKMYFEKLFETGYVKVMPYLSEMMMTAKEYVADFLEFIEDHKDVVIGVFIAMGAATAYFLLPPLLSTAAAALATIAPFLGIAAAIAAVIAVFAILYDDWATWMDGGTSALGSFWQFFADIWHQISSTVLAVMGDVANVFKDTFGVLIGIVKLFAALFTGNTEDIKHAWGGLTDSIGKLWGDAWKLAGDVLDAAVASFAAVWPKLWDNIKAGASAFTDWLGSRLDVVGDYFNSIAPNAMQVFRDIRDEVLAVFAIIGDVFKLVVALWSGDAATVSAIFDDLTADIRMFFTSAFDAVKTVAGVAFGVVQSIVESVVGAIVAIVTGFVPAVVGLFGNLAAGVTTIWSGLWSALMSAARGVLDWLTGRLDAVAALFSKIGQAIGVVKGPQTAQTGAGGAFAGADGGTPLPASVRPSAADATAALDAARPGGAASAIPPSVSNNSDSKTTITKETHIGEINIHTQAQDAQGIAQGIGQAVQSNSLADQADAGM